MAGRATGDGGGAAVTQTSRTLVIVNHVPDPAEQVEVIVPSTVEWPVLYQHIKQARFCKLRGLEHES